MQSDAKSAFYKKGHQNVRPGLHFGGLWGSLWSTLGTKWQRRASFFRGRIFGGQKVTQAIPVNPGPGAAKCAPALRNLNGWKALRP